MHKNLFDRDSCAKVTAKARQGFSSTRSTSGHNRMGIVADCVGNVPVAPWRRVLEGRRCALARSCGAEDDYCDERRTTDTGTYRWASCTAPIAGHIDWLVLRVVKAR